MLWFLELEYLQLHQKATKMTIWFMFSYIIIDMIYKHIIQYIDPYIV